MDARIWVTRERGEIIGGSVMAIGACAIIGSPAMVLWQSFQWLQYGAWPNVMVRDALQFAGLEVWPTGWLGLNKIIDGLLDAPLWFALLIGGVLIAWLGSEVPKLLRVPGERRFSD